MQKKKSSVIGVVGAIVFGVAFEVGGQILIDKITYDPEKVRREAQEEMIESQKEMIDDQLDMYLQQGGDLTADYKDSQEVGPGSFTSVNEPTYSEDELEKEIAEKVIELVQIDYPDSKISLSSVLLSSTSLDETGASVYLYKVYLILEGSNGEFSNVAMKVDVKDDGTMSNFEYWN